jgi:hypothetical protein
MEHRDESTRVQCSRLPNTTTWVATFCLSLLAKLMMFSASCLATCVKKFIVSDCVHESTMLKRRQSETADVSSFCEVERSWSTFLCYLQHTDVHLAAIWPHVIGRTGSNLRRGPHPFDTKKVPSTPTLLPNALLSTKITKKQKIEKKCTKTHTRFITAQNWWFVQFLGRFEHLEPDMSWKSIFWNYFSFMVFTFLHPF